MADFISHDLLGEQVLAKFPAAAQRAAALHPAAFRWGLQGPDPLYFHKVYAGSPLHKIGTRLHQEKTSELFTVFAQAIHRLTDTTRLIAEAYFYGFLCHYALDSILHPYVYFREYECLQVMPKENPAALHSQIETDIDSALYAHFKTERIQLTLSAYQLTDEETAVLAVLLHHIIAHVLKQKIPTRELRPIFSEMLAYEKLFYQGGRALGTSARRLERILGKGAILSSHVKQGLPQWDALNESRGQWYNLWHPEIVCTDSVLDLFAQSKERAIELANSYAAQFDSGWLLNLSFYLPFDHGNLAQANILE